MRLPRTSRSVRRAPGAGSDRFTGVLTEREGRLGPEINDLVPSTAHQAMLAVGGIEIIAGIVVVLMPRAGGLLVAADGATSLHGRRGPRSPGPSTFPSAL
jgi:hypothetical protein